MTFGTHVCCSLNTFGGNFGNFVCTSGPNFHQALPPIFGGPQDTCIDISMFNSIFCDFIPLCSQHRRHGEQLGAQNYYFHAWKLSWNIIDGMHFLLAGYAINVCTELNNISMCLLCIQKILSCWTSFFFFLVSVYLADNDSLATSHDGWLSILGKCGTGNSNNKAAQNTCCSGKNVQIHYLYEEACAQILLIYVKGKLYWKSLVYSHFADIWDITIAVWTQNTGRLFL